MKNSKIRKQLLLAAVALSLTTSPLFAAELNKTVAESETYTSQENSVTAGVIVVNGAWTTKSGKRAIANTQETDAAYGLIDIKVGENGKIATEGAADVFKFSDFTGSQTSEDVTFFRLENAGTISAPADRVPATRTSKSKTDFPGRSGMRFSKLRAGTRIRV